jgi:hypothetical protein
MEADWKKFRDMTPQLRERYLTEQNQRMIALLSDPAKTQTQRFWDTLDEMKQEAKTLQACLDGHSRSNMLFHMALMLRAGLLKKEELHVFSEALQDRLRLVIE